MTGDNTYHGGTFVSGGALVGTTTSLRGTVHNDAVIGFDQVSDGTFDGSIDETGTVVKTGTGTLTFVAPQTYSGLTRVAEGRLRLADGLPGSVLVDPGAVLSGSGTIAGSVAMNGTFVPNALQSPVAAVLSAGVAGGGPLAIAADLQLGPSATYVVPSLATTSMLRVGGHVAIAGATLAIGGANPVSARSTTFALFNAGGGTTGEFGRVDAAVPLDAFVSSHGTTALVTLERTDIPFASVATTMKGRAAGVSWSRGLTRARSTRGAVRIPSHWASGSDSRQH
jgi:autotransporter-associated beta strand protein